MTSKRLKDDGWFSFKYSHELKHLIPWRPNPKDKSLLPSNNAGLFSYFSLSWLTSIMFKAFKHGLNPSDLWSIQYEDSAAVNTQRLEHKWEEKKGAAIEREKNPKLWKTVFRSIRTRVLVVIALFILHSHLQVGSQVLVLKLVLNYINTPGTDDVYAGYIVLVYGLIGLCQIAVFSTANVINTHTVAKVTGGVQGLIYNKVLKLKTGGEKLTAQVVNVCNNDMERISEAVHSSGFTISGPILLLTTICYGLYLLGPWILIGQATIIFMCFLVGIVAKAQSKVRFETVKVTDKRVTLMTEIINSIKLIKTFAWEHSFTNNINDLRTVELKRQCSAAFLQAVTETLTQNINLLAVILTLIGYTLTNNTLHPSSAFIIASLFDSMQFTLGVLPWTVRAIVEAKVSLSRIQTLLEMPEHQARMDGYLNDSTLALEIKNASFAWENVNADFTEKTNAEKKQLMVEGKNKANKKNIPNNYSHLGSTNLEPPAVEGSPNQPIHFIDTLFNIDLRVTSGKLVGVCGNIGSGKSSLLSAIAGDMNKREGRVLINGDLSLVSQRAWIYNSTLRENILVGGRLDPQRYNDIIWACSLQDDFDLLHNGDMTEVGDRGINLSGGQKQRVNVARAVYSDGDVFLLDDPLSALDTKVARHIFTNCIKGLLAQKTIILVTHTVHLLKQCDQIIVMESGRITETGTHRELMTRKGEYYSIVNRDEEDTDKEETGKDGEEEKGRRRRRRKRRGDNERDLALSGEGRLTTEEMRRSGGVSWKVYRTIVQMCGGWGSASLILLSIVLFSVAKIFTSVWMKVWLDQGDGKMEERQRNKTHHNANMTEEELHGNISKNPDLWMYQMVYGLCYLCVFITGIVKSFSLPFWMLRGAGRLHSAMFDSIIRAPMRFFDTNPPGRIVNRFSRDLDDLDVRVPYFLGLLLTGLIFTAGQFILVSCIYVWFIIPLAIILALFILTDLFMNAGVRELKRLDNILRSPVTQHIVSTITGLSLIRTLKKQHLFRNRMYNYIDKHLASVLLYQQSNVWFVYRMNIISFMATLTITIICVFTKGIVSMASAGLAISSLNRVCSVLPFLMKRKADTMSRLTSVERIIEYAFEVESEAALETPYFTKPLLLNNWPSKGGIELMGVTLKYRPDLPPVLHGITASIKPAHKIGIVGRTGAGKSSLICALLRLCELDSGKILVDGVDISTVGLHTLRSNLSVIPQDPVLFQGTLRYNLDPFGEYTDLAVWEALEQAHLRDVISCQDNGLMSKVEAAGKNFSVGERQLICLARALLRSSKILMLDEATASVDQETDRVIQATIRQAFNTSTVLTIAHRLNTVAIYDKIMVLEAGQIVEFGSPVELMLRQTSVFREMMAAMGVNSVDQLKALI